MVTHNQQQLMVNVEERFFAAVSYVSILFLIGLLKKNSGFVQFHARQGMVLFLLTTVINIAGVLTPIVGRIFIMPIGNLIVLVLAVLGIFHAVLGKYWKMPYSFSDFTAKI